ncbi:MAG TPA: ROK family protein [Streptosporangiaceae bacterium]|nr:ROK family protein [Streptosporangiaceae bacterium]
MAIDIGGDKLIANMYSVQQGRLVHEGSPMTKKRTGGAGYIEVLKDASDYARANSVPMGISYAGPIQGTRVLAGVNVPVFIREFQENYGGDFSEIKSDITLVNDAEAGLLAASLEAVRRYPGSRNFIYVINGSGIGGAVLRGDEIIATEAGHIEIDNALNTFAQRSQCGLFGATYVCLERVGASKAGIEDIWTQQRGQELTGEEIAWAYRSGDELALRLYDSSAFVTAHIVKGIAGALDVLDEWHSTMVVGHGGTFKVPGYGERVRSIVAEDLSSEVRLLMTKDFSFNACLDGAAIAGISGVG